MKQHILSVLEKYAPLIPNHIRYLRHVRLRSDFVYQSVTQPIFERMGSSQKSAVDVGANLGIFTRYLKAHFAQTIAVEPIPELATKIDRIFGNSVRVENCALGPHEGALLIRTPVDAAGNAMHALTTASKGNDLKMFEHRSVVESTVPAKRLDSFDFGQFPLGFVKIDVEGFELDVLNGASRILAEDRPIFLIEISKGHNPDYIETLRRLEQANYHSFAIASNGLYKGAQEAIDSQPLSLSEPQIGDQAPFFDFLFVPHENVHIIEDLIRG